MGRVIVIEFITLDGMIQDPDGSGGTASGGWAFRHGPETVAGDKFQLGASLDTGVMLLGRLTWELFAGIWPGRDNGFAQKMNAIDKLVASRGAPDVSEWVNSSVMCSPLASSVRQQRAHRDVVVAGSVSVVHELIDNDLVDEFRLLVFPDVLGGGRRLFPEGRTLALSTTRTAAVGAAVLTRYERVRST
jgi:dihydrofolate reductase